MEVLVQCKRKGKHVGSKVGIVRYVVSDYTESQPEVRLLTLVKIHKVVSLK